MSKLDWFNWIQRSKTQCGTFNEEKSLDHTFRRATKQNFSTQEQWKYFFSFVLQLWFYNFPIVCFCLKRTLSADRRKLKELSVQKRTPLKTFFSEEKASHKGSPMFLITDDHRLGQLLFRSSRRKRLTRSFKNRRNIENGKPVGDLVHLFIAIDQRSRLIKKLFDLSSRRSIRRIKITEKKF